MRGKAGAKAAIDMKWFPLSCPRLHAEQHHTFEYGSMLDFFALQMTQ